MQNDNTRRDFLRLAAALGILGPALAGCGDSTQGTSLSGTAPPGAASSGAGAQSASLGRDYLALGLMGLSAAHRRGWARGHHGAAVIASYYFCEENGLDERTTRALRLQVEAFVKHRRSEFPVLDPGEGRADPGKIVERLALHIDQLRSGGHDVIYATLGLRALRELPEYATPLVVDGICSLLDVFTKTVQAEPETTYNREHPLPPYRSADEVAAQTLQALLRPWGHVEQVGAGQVVHWVTHGDALVALEELGFRDVARQGHAAHQRYLNQPVGADEVPEPDGARIDWFAPAYWESDAPRTVQKGTWFFGHSFKLPYSLFRLLRRSSDPVLREACLTRASRLSLPFA